MGIAEELRFGPSNLPQTTGKFEETKGRSAFVRFQEEVMEGFLNNSSLEKKSSGCGDPLAANGGQCLVAGGREGSSFLKIRR